MGLQTLPHIIPGQGHVMRMSFTHSATYLGLHSPLVLAYQLLCKAGMQESNMAICVSDLPPEATNMGQVLLFTAAAVRLRVFALKQVWQANMLEAVHRHMVICCSGIIHSFTFLACSLCSAHGLPAGRPALGHVHSHGQATGLLSAEVTVCFVNIVHLRSNWQPSEKATGLLSADATSQCTEVAHLNSILSSASSQVHSDADADAGADP